MKVSAVTSKICFRSNFTHFYNYMYGNCFTFNGAANDSLITTRTGPLYGRTAADSRRRALHTHALTHSLTHALTHARTSKLIKKITPCMHKHIDVYAHIHATTCKPHVHMHAYTHAHARAHMHRH